MPKPAKESSLEISGVKPVEPSTIETAEQVDVSKLLNGAQPTTLASVEEPIPAPTTPPDPAKLPSAPTEEAIAVAASHILVQYQGSARSTATRTKEEAKARIDKILLLARSQGANFKDLAKYSDEPGAALRGGSLGVFTRERMVPAFSDTAFAIQEGQVSDVIETEFGYHIILREPAYVLAQIPVLYKNDKLPPQITVTRTKEEAAARAKELQEKIKGGLGFTEASKLYSDVPYANIGNVISELMSNNELGPEFEPAKGLAMGAVSDPIEIEVGYLILQKQPIAYGYAAHILVTYKDSEFTKADPSVKATRSKEEAKKRAEEAAKKAAAPGAKFEELAKTYSDDPGTKDKGGDLGQPLIRGMAPSMMTEAILGLSEGQLSKVIETPYGFHVFKRLPKPAPAPASAPSSQPM